jgi:Pyruvate/2-oxoacid:ferredoxin oxidoreductase delta subunit/flavodoxin
MKQYLIYYYTGTGNSAHAASALSDVLKSAGHKTRVVQVKRHVEPLEDPYDSLILVFPVYSLTIPYTLRKFLKKLPVAKGTKAYIIVNLGMISIKGGVDTGYEGISGLQASRILSKRGYETVMVDKVGYPENLTIFANPPMKESIKSIITLADHSIRGKAGRILQEFRSIRTYSLLDYTLGWLMGIIFTYLGRWQIGAFYIADNDCTACGYCERSCPSGSIIMIDDRPRWTFHCDACLGCFNSCPENAIQVSWIRLVFVLGLSFGLIPLITAFYPALFRSVALILPFLEWMNHIPGLHFIAGLFLYALIYAGLLFAGHAALNGLSRLPIIGNWIRLNYTKNIKRYMAPKFRADRKKT